MNLALYRKYRPQVFSDIVGQNHIKVTLKNEIETGSLGHAYLFSGPRGSGKTTTARIFAKALNCLNRKKNESEPCNKCESCREIIDGNSLDLLEMDAASHTGVDNVRENIIHNSRFTPVKRKYKIFIVDEVHMLSISAFNALLKTLEEPPSYVVFILATTETHKIPLTIKSRCQHFSFGRVGVEDMISKLKT
ncbi:MAG: DNA polymerase III, subunit gamma and tau, partial [Candidatus Levybacteria bacterium CG10_big_fil_rev_8_21_14_0_10_36_7]